MEQTLDRKVEEHSMELGLSKEQQNQEILKLVDDNKEMKKQV